MSTIRPNSLIGRIIGQVTAILAAIAVAGIIITSASASTAGFKSFLEELRPEAIAAGVPATVYDRNVAGLEPDLSLPDLVIPGRSVAERGQAEFTQHPTDYLKRERLASLAA
ncbi:MAG: hypothetical protein HC841_04385 [Verrucomicrobiae bacterium]|nr:hypothetical protein [Verrucomicrobiae bacterium]